EIALTAFHLADKDQMVACFMLRNIMALEPSRAFRIVQHQGAARRACQGQVAESAGLRTIGESFGQVQLRRRQYMDDVSLRMHEMAQGRGRKSTRLNSSPVKISYA